MKARIRSLLIVVASIAVLAGAFFFYARNQPKTAMKDKPTGPTSGAAISEGERLNNLGAGEDIYLKRYDDRGQLASQFTATRYDPQEDGTVNVTEPVAEFFLRGGTQMMRVTGKSGVVVMQPAEKNQKDPLKAKGQNQPPNRGRLEDVKLELFDPIDADEPSLTVSMNNATFDNATFRIASDGYTEPTGKRVEPDQVPITVRGKDYDFDGRGLTIRWNELDQKLQLLEIAHGERLIVKNPKAIVPATGPSVSERSPGDYMLASLDMLAQATPVKKKKKRPAPPTATQPRIPEPPTLYRATFFDNLTIEQAGAKNVIAEKMDVEFLVESPDVLSNGPATEPSAANTTASDPAPVTTEKPRKHSGASTRPEDQPIIVLWTGKLHVVPADGPIDPLLAPGKAIVSFFGSPVQLMRNKAQAEAGVARYNTAGNSAQLYGTPAVPVVTLKDARGAVVTTPSLRFTETTPGHRVAILEGASSARVPTGDVNDPNQQTLAAEWKKICTLDLVDDESGNSNITDAKLEGDVKIDDPQMSLNSQSLQLSFTPTTQPTEATPTTEPIDRLAAARLRNMIAEGDVHCVMKESPEKTRTIDAGRLAVETAKSPDGKFYPKVVNADGNVHAVDADRDLSADHLTATLRPSKKKPSTKEPKDGTATADVELEKLAAKGNVKVADHKDGSFAAAEGMQIDVVDGQQRVKMIGQPLATVSSKENVLSGAEIQVMPDEQLARIPGAGTLKAALAGPTTRKVDVSWSGGAEVNGSTNLVHVDKDVRATSIDEDGTINQIESQKLAITLVAVPPKESEQEKKPAKDDELNKSFLKDKQVKSATFSGKAHVKSELTDPQGAIIRGVNLFAETINYDKLSGQFDVPGPGQMLYEDHRPKSQQPAEAKQGGDIGTLSGGRGNTAFVWKESLTYDASLKAAIMLGGVAIVHNPDEKSGQPFRMDADKVVAEMEEKKAEDKPAEDKPADPNAPPQAAKVNLKKFTSSGNVRVTSDRVTFECSELDYDPTTGLMIARATRDNPGSVTNEAHPTKVAFKELQWNTQTDQIKVIDLRGRAVR